MEKEQKFLFEKEEISKAIIKLALPSIAGQIILVIYNMADTFFVGLTHSDSMIAAVTVCLPAFMFLSAISNLFGIGGPYIQRALGESIWCPLFKDIVYWLPVFGYFLHDSFFRAVNESAKSFLRQSLEKERRIFRRCIFFMHSSACRKLLLLRL